MDPSKEHKKIESQKSIEKKPSFWQRAKDAKREAKRKATQRRVKTKAMQGK